MPDKPMHVNLLVLRLVRRVEVPCRLRHHLCAVPCVLQIGFDLAESPWQQPGCCVVVGVAVVVSSQSLKSSVSSHSQLLLTHAASFSMPSHLACALYDEPRQQPGV